MSETKDENKWSLLQESENVNNTTEFSEAKEYWRYKTKSWPKQLLNLLPEVLNDLARIYRKKYNINKSGMRKNSVNYRYRVMEPRYPLTCSESGCRGISIVLWQHLSFPLLIREKMERFLSKKLQLP